MLSRVIVVRMVVMMMIVTYYHVVQGTPCSSGPAAKVARDRSAASISVIVIVIGIVISIVIAIVMLPSPPSSSLKPPWSSSHHLGTLGLDVLAADPAHYSPLLVDLKLILLMKSISTEDDLTVFKKQI